MTDTKEDLNGYFCPSSDDGLPVDILGELESMLRLHSISPLELFYKWESYSLKMGSEETKLDLNTVRMFKKDVQDGLGREHRGKPTSRTERRNPVAATPRGDVNGDVFGMYVRSIQRTKIQPLTLSPRLDEITPNKLPRRIATNGSSGKRKGNFDTPAPTKVSRPETNGSPGTFQARSGGNAPDSSKYAPFRTLILEIH